MSVDKGKAKNVLSKSFVENHENIAQDEAEQLIVKSLKTIRELEDARSNDDKLTAAKQIVTDLNAGYSNAIKYEKAKISFLLEKIEEIESGDLNPSSSLNG